MSGAHTARDVSPTPLTQSLITMLASSSHDRNSDPEPDHITTAMAYTQHSCTRMLTKICLQNHQNQTEWYDAGLKEDEVCRLNKTSVQLSQKAPKLWHQHLVSILESLNYHPLLTDPSCFRSG